MKKFLLFLLLLVPFLVSCEGEELNQQLIDELWKETIRITDIKPGSPMPTIYLMENDLYNQLLRHNCSILSGEEKSDCEEELISIDADVAVKFGKTREEIYGDYLKSEWKLHNENCDAYDGKNKSQCLKDKNYFFSTIALGRAFLTHRRIEMYYNVINDAGWNWSRYYESVRINFTYDEKLSYFYNIVGHEMLHIAFSEKGIPTEKHHKLMLEGKYLEKLIDFISKKADVYKDGPHKEISLRSLKLGIERDETLIRIKERLNKSDKKPL